MLTPYALLSALLAFSTSAHPTRDPIELFYRQTNAGPVAGQIITTCNRPGVLALAFDDGPFTFTQALVDILNQGNAKGTFFFTGTLYGCIFNQSTAIKNAYDTGHQIASHSWSHPQDFGTLSTEDLTFQMTRLEDALAHIIGRKPTYMRPPFLATGGNVLPTMATLGYRVITDDVDSMDWNGFTVEQSQQQFIAAGTSGNGHIPLMHETFETTVNQLVPWLIDFATQNNLTLVTVADCLGDAGGEYTPDTVTGTGPQTC